jgi:long-chain acyl-CoA synthetase
VVSDVSTLALQCVDVPIFPSQTAKQIEYILNDSGAAVIIVSNRYQLTKVLKIRNETRHLRHVIIMNEVPEDAPDDVLAFSAVLAKGREAPGYDPDLIR